MSPAPVRHVFVYGTLRRGEERDITRLRPAPRWVGQASVPGCMVELGSYPGLVLGAPGQVKGEVYEISAALEQQLDVIEEVWPTPNGEYVKCQMVVWLECEAAAPREMICLVYALAPGQASGKTVIAGGDWVSYRAARARQASAFRRGCFRYSGIHFPIQ